MGGKCAYSCYMLYICCYVRLIIRFLFCNVFVFTSCLHSLPPSVYLSCFALFISFTLILLTHLLLHYSSIKQLPPLSSSLLSNSISYSTYFSISISTPLYLNRFFNSSLIQSLIQSIIHQVNSVESFVVGVKMRTDTQLSFQVRRMVPLEVRTMYLRMYMCTHVLTGIHVYNLSLTYD